MRNHGKLKSFGGNWTESKLDAFAKYVNAYLTIMNKYRDWYSWELIYFDGFAGSGNRNTTNETSELLNDLFKEESINIQDLNVYHGAAERVLKIIQRGFDYYYFIEKDIDSVRSLKEKLSIYNIPQRRLEFRCDDANSQLILFAEAMKRNPKRKALVLLDPFGMQVEWNVIKQLEETNTDLWILIPTGVIVNRLLCKNGTLQYPEKLTSFFGLDEDYLRNFFYKKEIEQTIFGEIETINKVSKPIQKIAELYIQQLKSIFPYVTEKPLVLYNSKNNPIFHFAFASNNKNAVKIAKSIIG